MNHLRRFNESLNKEELQDFCETYLAYLLDDGFEVSVEHRYNNDKKYKNYDYNFITIKKLDKLSNEFKWEEIKDQFIPFISVLSKEYKIGPMTFNGIRYYTWRNPYTQLGMDDRKYGKEPVSKLYYTKNIINDYINFKFPIEFITIVVQ